jgi:hypothetical protein
MSRLKEYQEEKARRKLKYRRGSFPHRSMVLQYDLCLAQMIEVEIIAMVIYE